MMQALLLNTNRVVSDFDNLPIPYKNKPSFRASGIISDVSITMVDYQYNTLVSMWYGTLAGTASQMFRSPKPGLDGSILSINTDIPEKVLFSGFTYTRPP